MTKPWTVLLCLSNGGSWHHWSRLTLCFGLIIYKTYLFFFKIRALYLPAQPTAVCLHAFVFMWLKSAQSPACQAAMCDWVCKLISLCPDEFCLCPCVCADMWVRINLGMSGRTLFSLSSGGRGRRAWTHQRGLDSHISFNNFNLSAIFAKLWICFWLP